MSPAPQTSGQHIQCHNKLYQWDFAAEEEARHHICGLCAELYKSGHCSGTGGGACIRISNDVAVVAPSGVPKECMNPADMFITQVYSKQSVLAAPEDAFLRVSQCTPLFHIVFQLRPTAYSVIHSHSTHAVLATLLLQPHETEVRITHMEMIKAVPGHSYTDTLVIPVIDNTAHECDLAESLASAITSYPRTHAVLVRRHGMYVWGDTWVAAKTLLESYSYLLECVVRAQSLNIRLDIGPDRTSQK